MTPRKSFLSLCPSTCVAELKHNAVVLQVEYNYVELVTSFYHLVPPLPTPPTPLTDTNQM